jgi:4-phytase/acid phosphatase
VFAWADVDQRTRATAEALLKGMFPDCGLTPGYRTDAKVDALFHPTRAGTCRIDPAHARQAVLDRVGGNFTSVTAAHRSDLDRAMKRLPLSLSSQPRWLDCSD